MPAKAGRIRMPAHNRVHRSAALQTHGIWQSAIGYDPYAPTNSKDPNSSRPDPDSSAAGDDPGSDNAYASFQGLLALARIAGSNATRGASKKCGHVGHLTFPCRNFLSAKENDESAVERANVIFDKIKRRKEESESEDSDEDSEMERIITERFGGKKRSKGGEEKRGRDKKRSVKRTKRSDDSVNERKRRRARVRVSDEEEEDRTKSREEKSRTKSQ